ncbi:unnamed protein product [Symbiodinium sp. CCMP2456]|nr:unnamed protein product [Symbiodinium sp. CCMP2456]
MVWALHQWPIIGLVLLCVRVAGQQRPPFPWILLGLIVASWCILPVHAGYDASSLQKVGAKACAMDISRLLPTPCQSSKHRDASLLPSSVFYLNWAVDPDSDSDDEDAIAARPTLLEQSIQRSDSMALYEAAILLDVLFEHFATCGPPRAGATAQSRVPLSLADIVPQTPYQLLCQRLASLIPAAVLDLNRAAEQDWLDNDLAGIASFPEAALSLRRVLPDIVYWHNICRPGQPIWVDIYTDGSASGRAEPLASAPCGWAFNVWITTAKGCFYYGHAASTAVAPHTPFCLGEPCDSPLVSEVLAICWALCWVIEYGPAFHCPICLQYDCLAAGDGTFAQSAPAHLSSLSDYPVLSHTAVALRQVATRRVDLHHTHVPGHKGDLGNELSDALAKRARLSIQSYEERALPHWPACLVLHPLLQWAWLAADHAGDLPALYALEAEAKRLQRLPQPSRPAPCMGRQAGGGTSSSLLHYHLCAATYNVLTLLDKPVGVKTSAQVGVKMHGRRHLLVRQIKAAGILFFGLQETRIQEMASLPDREYWMLHAPASPAGHFGCALWICRNLPYATCGNQRFYIELAQCTVAAVSPRHLLVHISAPHLRLAVLVAHAPSDPQDSQGIVRDFWAQRAKEIKKLPTGTPLLVLADANARLGGLESAAVGAQGAETESPAGTAFHDFLLAHQLYLPSTFADIHRGASWTWQYAPGVTHRLDYVAVSQQWRSVAQDTRVWYDIEALQKKCDHQPVVWTCAYARAPTAAPATFRRAACRPNDLDPGMDRGAFRALLDQKPLPGWHVDVDSHYQTLVTTWTQTGRQVMPRKAQRPQQTFLTSTTLDHVQQRKRLRQCLRDAEAEVNKRLCLWGFAVFTHHRVGSVLSVQVVEQTRRWIRAADHVVAGYWAALNQACVQELGVETTADQYAQAFAPVAPACPETTATLFDWNLLPTLAELERSILGLKRGKAAGPDSITSELLKLHTGGAARRLLPLFAKSLLALREPVEFKGGALFTLAKRVSASLECGKHRSIMVSSVPGKLMHQSLRRRLVPLLKKHGHDLQGGVHAGIGVDAIALAVRCFQAHTTSAGFLPGLIFFDVKAAYYQVVRETLTGVPDAAIADLMAQLTRLNHLASYGSSDHLIGMARELFRGTWFRLDADSTLVSTKAGVRPGDPLADIFFAVSFSAYVQSVQQELIDNDLHTVLPPCRQAPPFDDLDRPVSSTRPLGLMTLATAIGMQLTFAEDKTAVVLPPGVYHGTYDAFEPAYRHLGGVARASLYLRLIEHGPATLVHLLWLQWEATPGRSWLGQVLDDLRHVAQYQPSVSVLLSGNHPIHTLSETLTTDRSWWRRQVNAAIRTCLQDLQKWVANQAQGEVPAQPAVSSLEQAHEFACPFCSASFPLRKHLGVHVARRHGMPAPARLYTHHPTCVACLRHYHTVPRAQYHLKASRACMERACELLVPMSLADIKDVEAADKARVKKLRQGEWHTFQAAPPALQAFGPLQPTRLELLDYLGEEAPLTLLRRPAPDPEIIAWVHSELPKRTTEPPRTGTCSFWAHRIA